MKIAGLITEYNPFHNGHQYHIKKTRELTGADAVVAVMSGDFVQRGAPALLPKQLRAQMALSCGVSAVFELPVRYACGSAETFARGAVALLDALGVPILSFGSECGNLEPLARLAALLADEPAAYRTCLQDGLRRGLTFPAARQAAVTACTDDPALARILESPNNTLAVEYLKAIRQLGSSIRPFTVKRIGSEHHSDVLTQTCSSASAIRSYLRSAAASLSPADEEADSSACLDAPFFDTLRTQLPGPRLDASSTQLDAPRLDTLRAQIPDPRLDAPSKQLDTPRLDVLRAQIPASCLDILRDQYQIRYPVWPDDLSLLLRCRLLGESPSSLCAYEDVTPELASRICNLRDQFLTWESFCALIKTRDLTYTRVSRALLHILLGHKKTERPLASASPINQNKLESCLPEPAVGRAGDLFHSAAVPACPKESFSSQDLCPYGRLLGFRRQDTAVLHALKNSSCVPFITKLADAPDLGERADRLLAEDLHAAALYESVLSDKYRRPYQNEYTQPLAIV